MIVEGVPELRAWEHEGRSGVNFELVYAQVSIVAEPPRNHQAKAVQQSQADDAWETPAAWGPTDETPL